MEIHLLNFWNVVSFEFLKEIMSLLYFYLPMMADFFNIWFDARYYFTIVKVWTHFYVPIFKENYIIITIFLLSIDGLILANSWHTFLIVSKQNDSLPGTFSPKKDKSLESLLCSQQYVSALNPFWGICLKMSPVLFLTSPW